MGAAGRILVLSAGGIYRSVGKVYNIIILSYYAGQKGDQDERQKGIVRIVFAGGIDRGVGAVLCY